MVFVFLLLPDLTRGESRRFRPKTVFLFGVRRTGLCCRVTSPHPVPGAPRLPLCVPSHPLLRLVSLQVTLRALLPPGFINSPSQIGLLSPSRVFRA